MTRYLIDEPALITVLLSAFSQGSHIFPTLSESVRAITFFHLLVGPVGIDWIGKIIYQHQGSKINTRDKKTISAGGISLYKLNLCSRSNFQSEGYHACHVARTVGSGGANQTLVTYSNTDCLAYGNYIISPSSAAMLYLLKRL